MSRIKWLKEVACELYPLTGVYGMKNKETGDIDYVGQSSQMRKRIWEHLLSNRCKSSFLRNGAEPNSPIIGADNYEVIILWNGDAAANDKSIVKQNSERLFMEAFYIHNYQPKINLSKSTYTKFRKE